MTNVPVFCRVISVYIIDASSPQPHVLLLRRLNPPAGIWGEVCGSIEDNETPVQAAQREVLEEIGVELKELWSADINQQFFVPEKSSFEIIPVFVAFLPRDTPIKLNNEHDAHQWFPLDDAKTLVSFPGQRRTLRVIEDEFIGRAPTQHLCIPLPITSTEKPADLYARARP